MTGDFVLKPADIALPRGAFAGGGRDVLWYGNQPICAFTRGKYRPCLHPVWTPAGHVVTAEQPADHPHHRGIWCASDHVGLLMEGPDGIERYDYCFYVDDIFQGRAPGRIEQTGLHIAEQSQNMAVIEQELAWIGPPEWGAVSGRHVLCERRWTAITRTDEALILDISCEVSPAGDVAVTLGPTRHAWFNARVADSIAIDPASAPSSETGARGADNIASRDTARVDYSGTVGGKAQAGVTVIPTQAKGSAWFVADWGVITVGNLRDRAQEIEPGSHVRFSCRIVAHDGPTPKATAWDGITFVAPEDILNRKTGDHA